MTHPALAAVATLTDRQSVSVRPIGGHVFTVELAGGDLVVAKRHSDPGAARAEAAGLGWLAEPGVVAVPRVLGFDDDWVIMEKVTDSRFENRLTDSRSEKKLTDRRSDSRAADEFGRDLAALHAAGASAFGAAPPGGPVDAWIGMAPMRNEPGHAWPSWYATHRVEPYMRRAVNAGTLDTRSARVIERVCERIDDLAGPAEPPARLHGDLWSGNVLWAEGGAWLIDPAAHGGHRETDLAMLALFGCPHLDRILRAYDEAAPLAPGWRDRVPLHQLFPLLVHTVLFGGSYAAQTVAAAAALG